ncbi:MAG TPA: hypothetical protein VHL79_06310 [Ramlibacter sp.]|jgi:hypothetical protein|nr:hypothetical protein [Ramlibacter sp.]
MRSIRLPALVLLLACSGAQGEELQAFSSRGLPGSRGIDVRMQHPAAWKKVPVDDPMAVAELRGPHGRLTAILQVGRGAPQSDMQALCHPERARTMLQGLEALDTRVTDVVARQHEGRPGFELSYERSNPPTLVRSVIVCLKDTRVVVSCGASGPRPALGDIEPVCRRVLGTLTISED